MPFVPPFLPAVDTVFTGAAVTSASAATCHGRYTFHAVQWHDLLPAAIRLRAFLCCNLEILGLLFTMARRRRIMVYAIEIDDACAIRHVRCILYSVCMAPSTYDKCNDISTCLSFARSRKVVQRDSVKQSWHFALRVPHALVLWFDGNIGPTPTAPPFTK